jgi:hypothetical protein
VASGVSPSAVSILLPPIGLPVEGDRVPPVGLPPVEGGAVEPDAGPEDPVWAQASVAATSPTLANAAARAKACFQFQDMDNLLLVCV